MCVERNERNPIIEENTDDAVDRFITVTLITNPADGPIQIAPQSDQSS